MMTQQKLQDRVALKDLVDRYATNLTRTTKTIIVKYSLQT